jgi:molecular chaperone DnaK
MSYPDDDTVLPPSRPRVSSVGVDGDTVLPPQNASSIHVSGDVIDNRYTVIREIGRGGMGVVYEVEDSILGGRYAVKRLLPELVSRKGITDVFRREGANAMQFTSESPRFVTLRYVGADYHGLYLVMDYVDDPTLRTLLNSQVGGRLSAVRAIPILKELASALVDLHRLDYVHRDLKPENIFVRSSKIGTHVRLVDFGLTKELGEGTLSSLRGGGTSGYASPEQRKGLNTSFASDVYSYGVLAFELLVGELPGPGDSIDDYVNDVPSAIRNFIMSCLSTRIDRRPKDGRALLAALHQSLSNTTSDNDKKAEGETATSRSHTNETWGVTNLVLTGMPNSAAITIDGTPLSGNSRDIRFPGQAHRCSLSVKCRGFEDYSAQVDLLAGINRILDLSACLRKLPEPNHHTPSNASDQQHTASSKETSGKAPPQELMFGVSLANGEWAMSTFVDDGPILIPNAEGDFSTPAVLHITESGTRLMGKSAQKQAIMKPDRTVGSVARNLTTGVTKVIDNKSFTATDVATSVIAKLKADAEAFLGGKINSVVVAIPSHLGVIEKNELSKAFGSNAIKVSRFVGIAQVLSFAEYVEKETNATVMLINFDYASLDIVTMEVGDGVFEVKSLIGIALGGCDFTSRVAQSFVEAIRSETGIDLSRSSLPMNRLTSAAEQAILDLVSAKSAQVSVPYLIHDGTLPFHFDTNLTLESFNKLTADSVATFETCVIEALKNAKLGPSDIDEVILSGTTVRIANIKATLGRCLKGCAVIRNVTSDRIAAGTAEQVGVLVGLRQNLVLLDVTDKSLGVQTADGQFATLIACDTTIPTRKEEIFVVNQTDSGLVTIPIIEQSSGGDQVVNYLTLRIPATKNPGHKVRVTFDIDAMGLLSCSVSSLSTKSEATVKVDGKKRFTVHEQNQIRKDARLAGIVPITGIDIQPGIDRLNQESHPCLRNYLYEICQIRGGNFAMGGAKFADERPIHNVLLSDFALGKTPVTVAMWREYANEMLNGAMPSVNDSHVNQHPITQITWNDCIEYCKWASDLTGLTIKLPSEAQWEYACRGGSASTVYAWGDSWNAEYVWSSCDNQQRRLSADVQRSTNVWRNHPFGLVDMIGNVWEWCADWYDPNWYQNPEAIGQNTVNRDSNPEQLMKYRNGLEKRASARSVRGGSWSDSDQDYFRCAQRNRHIVDSISHSIGFRLCVQ